MSDDLERLQAAVEDLKHALWAERHRFVLVYLAVAFLAMSWLVIVEW